MVSQMNKLVRWLRKIDSVIIDIESRCWDYNFFEWDIPPTVKAAGFCKRDIPTLKQIKAYLKKVKKVSKETLNEVNDSNVVEKCNVINNWNSVRDRNFQTLYKYRQY